MKGPDLPVRGFQGRPGTPIACSSQPASQRPTDTDGAAPAELALHCGLLPNLSVLQGDNHHQRDRPSTPRSWSRLTASTGPASSSAQQPRLSRWRDIAALAAVPFRAEGSLDAEAVQPGHVLVGDSGPVVIPVGFGHTGQVA